VASSAAYRDPAYIANRATLLASRPNCIGFPAGRHPRPVRATTADHRIPLLWGGSHDLSNLDPLCGPCNSRKSRKDIDNGGWRH
jgi:5-methylcytosine-specific restriction endonuclease McrA